MSRHHAVDGLVIGGHSPVHRLPAHGKLLAVVGFVLVVVATPVGNWTAYAGYALALAFVATAARFPPLVLARRCAIEAPFVVFALLMPFVATGPRIEMAGLSLSEAGLIGAGTLLCKATIGVVAAVLLAGTTSARDLLAGLDRLRLPTVVVTILSFMVRYASVVAEDLHRMRVARESRGCSGSRLGHLRAVAAGAGTLFVRSYGRGERVHLAMLARGYAGRMPSLATPSVGLGAWVACATLPLAAALVLAVQQAVPA
jgi:cobalt/nickel transport system permease protein